MISWFSLMITQFLFGFKIDPYLLGFIHFFGFIEIFIESFLIFLFILLSIDEYFTKKRVLSSKSN